jgi:hypothetical protein
MIVLSALFAAGMGLASAGSAVAAPISNGASNAAMSTSLIEQAAYRCRMIRVCRAGPYGRRVCRTERVCRSHW